MLCVKSVLLSRQFMGTISISIAKHIPRFFLINIKKIIKKKIVKILEFCILNLTQKNE